MNAGGVAEKMGEDPISPPRGDGDPDLPARHTGRVGTDDVRNICLKCVSDRTSVNITIAGDPIVDETFKPWRGTGLTRKGNVAEFALGALPIETIDRLREPWDMVTADLLARATVAKIER